MKNKILMVLLLVPVSLWAGDNNVDGVEKCLKKSRNELANLKTCAAGKQVADSKPPREIVIDEWKMDQKVGHSEEKRVGHDFEAPARDYWFCGYQVEISKQERATWNIYDVSGKGASVVTVLKGEGTMRDPAPAALALASKARWIPKELAGHASSDLMCDGNGWSMKPIPSETVVQFKPRSCVNHVMVCSVVGVDGKEGKLRTCGVCQEANKDFN